MTTIGLAAFKGCTGFTGTLVIPDKVTTIGGGAFTDCSGFTSDLVIPDSVTTIYDRAFNGCSGITSLTIGSGVKTIGESAFARCGLTSDVVIPLGVTSVGEKILDNQIRDGYTFGGWYRDIGLTDGPVTSYVAGKTYYPKWTHSGEVVLTISTDKGVYFLGDDITFNGTYSSTDTLYFYIKGINLAFTQLQKEGVPITASGAKWSVKITDEDLRKTKPYSLDAGNYTFYVSPINSEDMDVVTSDVCATVMVPLKPAFIEITDFPTIVIQGDHLIIKGIAEGHPPAVKGYIFGTNFFITRDASVNDDGTYEFDIEVPKEEEHEMEAGQYFAVIQHPMYDKVFNVGPKQDTGSGQWGIYKNEQSTYEDGVLLFNLDYRQTANALQALCGALDDENIDDMYTKVSFLVVSPSSVINPIPDQIVKGEILTVSGQARGHKGEAVSVELRSTSFGPEPKDAVGTSSFFAWTTRVQDDGTWAVNIDTSEIGCDEYTLSVKVGQLSPATQKITIVEGPFTKTTYTLTDPESVSGGPLQIIGKEIVVYNQPRPMPTIAPTSAPTQEPGQKSSGSGSSIWITEESDSEFETGDSVKATLQVLIPKDTVTDADKIIFDTGLTGASWTVSISTSWGMPLSVRTLSYPNNYLSGFDVHYPYDILLDITLTGYVPAGNLSEISVMKVSTTSNRGSGLKSYNVRMKNIIPHADLTLQKGWNFISVPKKLAAENDTAGELFAGVNTGGKAPLSYNAQTKQWEQVTSSTVISPLNAYWIYSTGKLTLKPAFDTTPSVPSVKNVYTGWNAVGASVEEPIAAKAAFTGVNWRSYTLWNGETQAYGTIYIKGGTGKYSDEQPIPLYKGGWLYMDGDGTINGYA